MKTCDETERFADSIVYAVIGVLFITLVLPDLVAWVMGLPPVLVVP